jgi:hypothetical protein
MTINWNVCSPCAVIRSYKKLILYWVKFCLYRLIQEEMSIFWEVRAHHRTFTCTPNIVNVLWKKYNADWPFRGEPISDHAVLTTAVCSARESSWQVSWTRPLLRFDACEGKQISVKLSNLPDSRYLLYQKRNIKTYNNIEVFLNPLNYCVGWIYVLRT